MRELPEWSIVEDGQAITRTFRFPDYYRTMAFVNALAYIAHDQDHHPDLGVHYDRCVVRYSTHDVGGLSENDFICAAKADALLG
jgi:4a-hydroxytetrahydrobiopterin dehydratase